MVLPIHMGVILCFFTASTSTVGTPHTHGGDSISINCQMSIGRVLPIHMGVILDVLSCVMELGCTPHTHGGDSIRQTSGPCSEEYSPYTWG